MYCIHCGAMGAAKFCASCGQSQGSCARDSNPTPTALTDVSFVIPPSPASDVKLAGRDCSSDWTNTIDYETILSQDHARQRIATASRAAGPSVTGDDVLEIFDAVSPIGFSLAKFTKVILPLYDKFGIKTDRQAQCIYDTAPGRLMLSTLCAIASNSLTIDEVNQAPNRCSLSAEIPSGLVTNRGRLIILIEAGQTHCQITLHMTISGQWYDWGKSDRLMSVILAEILADLTDQHRGQCPQFRRVA